MLPSAAGRRGRTEDEEDWLDGSRLTALPAHRGQTPAPSKQAKWRPELAEVCEVHEWIGRGAQAG
jgi:hypothetical protein